MEAELAWENLYAYLSESTEKEFYDFTSSTKLDILNNGLILHKEGLLGVMDEWLTDELEKNFEAELRTSFWNFFNKDTEKNNSIEIVPQAFGNLFELLSRRLEPFYRLKFLECKIENKKFSKDKVKKAFFTITHSLISSIIFLSNKNFYDKHIRLYLQKNIEICENLQKSGDLVFEKNLLNRGDVHCNGIQVFLSLLKNLAEWKMLNLIITNPFLEFLSQKIEVYIKTLCEATFEKSYINSIFDWISKNISEDIFNKILGSELCNIKLEAFHIEKFKFYAIESYGQARINQLFDIIIEFPDSFPVLEDLVICLKMNSNLKKNLVISLKNALRNRLLHQGVTTSDILTAYIATMRALRILDQSGVMLEVVGEPVKKYLKHRDDTVRSIVTSLTEECNDDLANELNRKRLLADDDDSGEESIDVNNWHKWEPDPVEAEPLKTSQASRSFDIVSMLVNIYGSKELFIDEYRTLLADRILTQKDIDMDKEIRNLELLKLRFGENQLHQCEVMLKDVTDSRRINAQIVENDQAQNTSAEIPIECIILSAQFWPSRLKDDNVELPSCILNSMEHFKKRFEILKGNRTLFWKPHLGLVDMEIEMNGHQFSFEVSPVHATIMWHFQNKSKYSLDELSALMQMPSQALHRKIVFWQRKGILKEDGSDSYSLVEDLRTASSEELNGTHDEGLESALISNKDHKEEKFQVIWSYIVGMLTNLESLTLERMHSMLKMFSVQGPGSQCSMEELKNVLDAKVKESKLTYFNGTYRLAQNT